MPPPTRAAAASAAASTSSYAMPDNWVSPFFVYHCSPQFCSHCHLLAYFHEWKWRRRPGPVVALFVVRRCCCGHVWLILMRRLESENNRAKKAFCGLRRRCLRLRTLEETTTTTCRARLFAFRWSFLRLFGRRKRRNLSPHNSSSTGIFTFCFKEPPTLYLFSLRPRKLIYRLFKGAN